MMEIVQIRATPEDKTLEWRIGIVGGSLWLAMCLASGAFGRFTPSDADEIDREERLSTEFYNDVVSYRFPLPWIGWWESTHNGYRVSAGSLNASRFEFLEEIKFFAPTSGSVDFSFRHLREESMLEQQYLQELRLSYKLHPRWKLGMLGSGGTFKKWGDLGAVLRFHEDDRSYVELFYWSVDHFFNTKEEEPQNRYAVAPKTYGLDVGWTFPSGQRWRGHVEVDTPVEWVIADQARMYRSQKRRSRVELVQPLSPELHLEAAVTSIEKDESGVWYSSQEETVARAGLFRKKELSRSAQTALFGTRYFGSHSTYRFLAEFALHRADYEFTNTDGGEIESDEPSHDAVRREFMLGATRYRPIGDSTNLQTGLFYNRASIDDEKSVHLGELKFQTAFDFVMSESLRSFLNLTWDVDQLYRDYPDRFRPWGGGHLQIQATF